MEALIAKDAGLDPSVIEEYSTLRKNIDVDKNLLEILKNSSGMNIPNRAVPPEDLEAINKLIEKIKAEEARLKEINEKFNRA